MNIGFVATKLSGTDGLSLESKKLIHVLERMGHNIFICAGDIDPTAVGVQAPELSVMDPIALALWEQAFGSEAPSPHLIEKIAGRAQELKPLLRQFIADFNIHFLIIENIFAVPRHLPLAQALAEIVEETSILALARHHDLYWQLDLLFSAHTIEPFLSHFFPPNLPNLRHATLNSLAQASLKERRGLESVVIPNVFNFSAPIAVADEYNQTLRPVLGLQPDDWFILVPNNIMPGKGIEIAIQLAARLGNRAHLVLPRPVELINSSYLQTLQLFAQQLGVHLHHAAPWLGDKRGGTGRDGRPQFVMGDFYQQANLVAYPTMVEGFGHSLLETMYYHKPALVNRYPVYVADIAPYGFQFIEINGLITDEVLGQVKQVLENPAASQQLVNQNFELGKKHFSLNRLENLMKEMGF